MYCVLSRIAVTGWAFSSTRRIHAELLRPPNRTAALHDLSRRQRCHPSRCPASAPSQSITSAIFPPRRKAGRRQRCASLHISRGTLCKFERPVGHALLISNKEIISRRKRIGDGLLLAQRGVRCKAFHFRTNINDRVQRNIPQRCRLHGTGKQSFSCLQPSSRCLLGSQLLWCFSSQENFLRGDYRLLRHSEGICAAPVALEYTGLIYGASSRNFCESMMLGTSETLSHLEMPA